MRLLRLPIAVIAVALASAACGGGGDDGGGDDGPDVFPERGGRYDSPDDFDRTGCQDGSLAGIDPQAIYHFQIDWGDGFPSTTSARFDTLAASSWGGVIAGRDATWAFASKSNIFLTVDFPIQSGGTGVRSLDLCAHDGDILTGRYAYCNATDCSVGLVTAKQVKRLAEADASHLELLGELQSPGWGDGLTVNVRVAGDLAYLARYQDGLRIVDVSNPAAPHDVGHGAAEHPERGEIYNDVKIVSASAKTYALMASSSMGVVVWDVTNPAAPTIAGHFGTPDANNRLNIHTIFIDGGKAYIANLGRGLEIWSIADPAAAVKLGEFFPSGAPDGAFLHDLYIDGGRAYLNFWNAGMVVADVSNPAAPVGLGTFVNYGETSSHSSWVTTVGNRRIAAHGDEQWGSHLRLVDVTEGTSGFMKQTGEWQTRPEVSAHNVMAFGSEVFMAHYQDGVRIIDISNPGSPREAAWFNTWPGYDRGYGYSFYEAACGIDVDQARGLIYVADVERGLLVLHRN